MKINYKDPIYWLIILSVSFFLWGTCQKNKVLELKAESVKAQHQEQLKALETKQANSEAVVKRLEQDRKRATDSAQTQQRARLQEIQGFKATITKLKLTVLPQIDTNTDLSHLISTQDLVIRKQDNLIDSLQLAHSAEIVNLDAQLVAKTEQLMIEGVKTKLWEEVAVKNEKDYNKERRRKSFWRTTASILAGGVLFLTISK